MATRIREWSESAAGNNATVAGINFAEGQLPSTVNNSARELMAQVRSWYHPDEAGWTDWGATASVNSQTVIKLAGDQTGMAVPGRRIRLRGGSVAARYATVLSASFTAETAITLQDADGSLSASMSIMGLAVHPNMMPRRLDRMEISATLTVGGSLVVAGSATLSGTVTVKTGMSVSGNVRVGGAVLIGFGSSPAMAIFANINGQSVAMPGAATNSYSVSVAGFSPVATGGGLGVLLFDEPNTVAVPRIMINGNGPYGITAPSFGSLTAGAIVAARLYMVWFQGGAVALLNPSAS